MPLRSLNVPSLCLVASPVSQGRGVNLNEAGAVDEHLGAHVAHGDQLGAVLQARVVLLQDLEAHQEMFNISTFITPCTVIIEP